MISFINAKINIGLFVTSRRPDGYHDLETLFYPVGCYNGTPECPTPFCDILEIVPKKLDEGCDARCHMDDRFHLTGRQVDCPLEKNLVYKAVSLYRERAVASGMDPLPPLDITLDKHLPDGAGLGGGSADASFTLRMLDAMSQDLYGKSLGREALLDMALSLGADCPFFIDNVPAFASGVGECLEPVPAFLDGCWLVIVKPDVYVSTREAFAGLTPEKAPCDLRHIPEIPVSQWDGSVRNDFEKTVGALHPEIFAVRDALQRCGAKYVSMSGSGSSVYAIFDSKETASEAFSTMGSTYDGCWLLKL